MKQFRKFFENMYERSKQTLRNGKGFFKERKPRVGSTLVPYVPDDLAKPKVYETAIPAYNPEFELVNPFSKIKKDFEIDDAKNDWQDKLDMIDAYLAEFPDLWGLAYDENKKAPYKKPQEVTRIIKEVIALTKQEFTHKANIKDLSEFRDKLGKHFHDLRRIVNDPKRFANKSPRSSH